MKKTILVIFLLLLLMAVNLRAETYTVVEFSPLKLTMQKAEYSFYEDFTFLYWSVTPEKNLVTIYGEYEMLTFLDGAAYLDMVDGSSIFWFMKDEDILIGWRALIENKYDFNFYIILGIIK